MKKILGLLLFCSEAVLAQQHFTVKIINEDSHLSLAGATVTIEGQAKGTMADSSGIAILAGLQPGRYTFRFSCIGYRSRELVFSFPITGRDTLQVGLEPSVELLQDVVVSTTRLNQHIRNIPVHIDVISREDIEEGTAMSPGNIRELLSELSGTQVQQTSAVSGNVTIRLQGLDGRYTQLLKDGFPLYGGFSGGLSVMQVPPLDLQQVEVIKGAGSALYGGDAIAGIINLITKTPEYKAHADILLNQSLKGGTDLSGFYSSRGHKTGVTLLTTTSRQQAFDVNKDGFTDLPRVRQLTVTPTFFWYPNDSTTLRLGLNISTESRTGGDITAVDHGADSLHPFLEKNHTDRDHYQLSYTRKFPNRQVLTVKNTAGYFYRSLELSGKAFSGTQVSSFTEASYLAGRGKHQALGGVNVVTDKFMPAKGRQDLGYAHNTFGLFVQDDWKITRMLTLETGVRTDFNRKLYFLPRIALMYTVSPRFTTKIGAGTAYKLPTVFTARTEEEGYQQVYPLPSGITAEQSAGGNLSLNYHGYIGEDIHFTIGQNFYYTHLTHALVPQEDSLQNGWLYYINAPGGLIRKGLRQM
jgi:iron complex outermembrane receptor protein